MSNSVTSYRGDTNESNFQIENNDRIDDNSLIKHRKAVVNRPELLGEFC